LRGGGIVEARLFDHLNECHGVKALYILVTGRDAPSVL